MRTIVISDIHGHYDELVELLEKLQVNEAEDMIVFLGDYVDRGPKSKEVLQLIKNITERKSSIAIMGNHDYRFVRWIEKEGNGINDYDYMETLCSFMMDKALEEVKEYILMAYSEEIEFLKTLPYYYEDDDYIYVHAGLDLNKKDWKETSEKDMMEIRIDFYGNKTKLNKKVIFGHTPCRLLHGDNSIFFENDKIGIDGGIGYNYQLNALVIHDNGSLEEYFVKKHSV